MCICVCTRLYKRIPSSGPALRHEVKEMAIGRHCARKRKEEAANEVARAARGERKWVKRVAEIGVGVHKREKEREKETETWRVASRGVLIVAQHPWEPFLPTAANLPTYPKHSTSTSLTLSAVTRLPSLPPLAFPFTLFIHSPLFLPSRSPFSSDLRFCNKPLLSSNSVLPAMLLDRSWRNPVRHPSSCIQRVNY